MSLEKQYKSFIEGNLLGVGQSFLGSVDPDNLSFKYIICEQIEGKIFCVSEETLDKNIFTLNKDKILELKDTIKNKCCESRNNILSRLGYMPIYIKLDDHPNLLKLMVNSDRHYMVSDCHSSPTAYKVKFCKGFIYELIKNKFPGLQLISISFSPKLPENSPVNDFYLI